MAEITFYVVSKDDCLIEGMSKEQILTAIEQSLEQGYVSNPDSAVFSKIKEIRANETAQIWIGTEAQFNAISPAPTIGRSIVRIGENGVMYICSDDSTLNDFSNHLNDKNNPHGVTFNQVAGADVLPTSKGGTGNTNGRAASAASADKATKLATARAIQTNLASTSAASFDGSANATPGVSGVLPIGNGGTGNTNGRAASAASADKATKLATARAIQTNLASTSAASFDGSANATPGVSGVLPIGNGGTGAANAEGACANIGAVKKSGDTMTGALAAPAFQVKGTNDGWDGIDILRSSDGEYRGGVTSMGAQNNLVLRERSTNGGTEYYKLPIPSASEDVWFNILTDKSPVTVEQGGTNSRTRAGAAYNLVNAGNVDDANTSNDIGMYTYGNASANVPYAGWGTIFTFQGNQPWLNQIAITTDNPPHIFYRTNINNSGWGSWLEFYTKGNVVYSSSQPAVIDGGIWLKPV